LETSNVRLTGQMADMHLNLPQGEYVILSVTDTGRGIDENIMTRLFEPFFTTKEVGKGTGLGLSMVYGIVQQSGGAVAVSSTVGNGASFNLYLPMAKADAPSMEGSESNGNHGGGGNETILLVEDEEGVRNLVKQILSAEGYTVLEAGGGEEALLAEEKHEGPIHLLLADFIMPEMNGREVYAAISPRRPGIKVLYMSGYTGDAFVRHGVETSGSEFLQKPFSPSALTDKVHSVLKESEKSRVQ
jgi:two-component system cell cycle sensor histidine kinase/response regulator CckA